MAPGSSVVAEVLWFGPLGASVLLSPPPTPTEIPGPVATGLVLQSELALYREQRGGEGVMIGEVLTGFVGRVHPIPDDAEEGAMPKVDVSLRPLGAQGQTDAASRIMNALNDPYNDGVLQLGDRSPPEDISQSFPGMTKSVFKKAVGKLFKEGKIERPEKTSIRMAAAETSTT
ncbi:hypothetical protein TeGR_g8369 [Tetraparma gracilis]|uniref:Conserved virulence factor B-like winged helix domain-containing protein n=1 Tax=Tetraparma gracilis TaxID=2962635 RepID=A0ABQ6N9Z9_9STRA|nr:hypothetical protein TeGR_g8369 [Tetraparma gracilis]